MTSADLDLCEDLLVKERLHRGLAGLMARRGEVVRRSPGAPLRTAHHLLFTEAEEHEFRDSFRITDEDCWVWQDTYYRGSGPRFRLRDEHLSARRVAYANIGGIIHPKLIFRNRCGNRRCVHPNHYEIAPSGHLRKRWSQGGYIPIVRLDEAGDTAIHFLVDLRALS